MALVNLGTRTIAVGDGFVSFSPVELRTRFDYLLYAQTVVADDAEPYSRFVLSYSFISDNGYLANVIDFADLYPRSGLIAIPIKFPLNLQNRQDIVFEAKRVGNFSHATNLPSIDLTLQIDPDERDS